MTDTQNYSTSGNGSSRVRARDDEGDGLLPQVVRILAEQEPRVREFIRSHPLPVVAGALVVGFAIARWLRED